MNITFDELRRIKHALPHGSIARIALDLGIEEQTVRNYFGAHHYEDGAVVDFHLEPGPDGGIVHLEDTTILERARAILVQNSLTESKTACFCHRQKILNKHLRG
jgi:hypothetical protein